MAEDSKTGLQQGGAGKKPMTTPAAGNARPSVIQLGYKDKTGLQRAYMAFVKGGGLFFPTTASYGINDEVFLLVRLPDSEKPISVPGIVVWQSPGGAPGSMKPGVGIEFRGREGNSLRNRIEGILGARVASADPTYTM